jgi:hypothetical protein
MLGGGGRRVREGQPPLVLYTVCTIHILGLSSRSQGGLRDLFDGPYSLLALSGRAPRALKNSGESAQVPRGREQAVCGERPTCVSAMEPIRAVGSVRKRRTSDLDRETPDDRTVDNFGVC